MSKAEIILDGLIRDVSESDSESEVLVRGWLWIDQLLSELIRAALEAPESLSQDALDWMRFDHKIQLAAAQGFLAWPSSLRALQRTRNRLAHNPHFRVDAALVAELAGSFEPDFGMLGDDASYCEVPTVDQQGPIVEQLRAILLGIANYLFVCLLVAAELRNAIVQRQIADLQNLFERPEELRDRGDSAASRGRDTSPPET